MTTDYKNRLSNQYPAHKISVTFCYGGEMLTPAEQRAVMDEMGAVAKRYIKMRDESELSMPERVAAGLAKLDHSPQPPLWRALCKH